MHSQWAQAYAVLTLCRAFYTVRNGGHVSKKKAASWTEKQFPEWSSFIQKALSWSKDRQSKKINNKETFTETVRFVKFVRDQILAK